MVTGTCPENEILEGTDLLLECTATGIWETAVWLVNDTLILMFA